MDVGTRVLRDDSGGEHNVILSPDGNVSVNGDEFIVERMADGSMRVIGESQHVVWTAAAGDTRWVFIGGRVHAFEVQAPGVRRRRPPAHHGTLMAPMPATVRKILVGTGDLVRRGDVLIVLEAMKMELPIRSTTEGRVTAINCGEGDLVQPGVSLIEIDG